ncbi:unnamed protein product [Phaedon cochleariae]|uniref:Zinc finger PHD-type domain-containing protein n=1 Tax=Phaedon cochleariae TaxID=80249 RepID=A0A9N9SN33_PHACE|nr:unnamed protein product [Phaedon cochleariae]
MSSYNKCLGCKKEALEDRTTFKCDGCKRLIHITCAGVTATEVKCLQLSSRKMKYFCDDCEEGLLQVPILRKLLEELQIEVEKLKKTNMDGLQDKQQEVDKLRKEVKGLREHRDFGNVESMFGEINERLNRANNLMIYNVPESRSRDLKSKIDDDKEKVREIMHILDIRDAESNILKVLRVGRSDGSRAKPLKVVFFNSYLVREILKSKQKLQQSNFRISADRKKLQQEIFKKVKKELMDRQENANTNAVTNVNHLRSTENVSTTENPIISPEPSTSSGFASTTSPVQNQDPICPITTNLHLPVLNQDPTFPIATTLLSPPAEFSTELRNTLPRELANWAVKGNIPHHNFDKLLEILKKGYLESEFLKLPSDCRTLLMTKQEGFVIDTKSGKYFYFGILYVLNSNKIDAEVIPNTLEIDINVDGLPLAKTSKSQFWPILGSISNLYCNSPFVIGVYHGYGKPETADELLDSFITEFLHIANVGITYKCKKLAHLKDSCWWPSKKDKERKFIKGAVDPEKDWTLLENVKVLGHYTTYKEAFIMKARWLRLIRKVRQIPISIKYKREEKNQIENIEMILYHLLPVLLMPVPAMTDDDTTETSSVNSCVDINSAGVIFSSISNDDQLKDTQTNENLLHAEQIENVLPVNETESTVIHRFNLTSATELPVKSIKDSQEIENQLNNDGDYKKKLIKATVY